MFLGAYLEAEDLILNLAHRPRLLVPQTLGGLLERRNHRRRSAHKDLDVRSRSRKLRFDHNCRDEAHAAVPLLRRVVQHIVHPKLVILRGDGIDVLLQQDILGVDVREDEIDLCPVAGRAPALNGFDNLQHGCDSGTAGDHAEVAHEVGRVDHGALGAAHFDGLPWGEGSDVLGDVAGGVRFDEDIDVAAVFVGGDGRVGADDFLAVDGGGEGDVLADGEAENVGREGEGEAVAIDLSVHEPRPDSWYRIVHGGVM